MVVELIGYIGSALVLVSFLMVSVKRLRLVNMAGSLIFMVYALIIRSYPTAVMNFCLVLINLRFLWKEARSEKLYDVVRVGRGDAFLQYVLEKYREDIARCFPGLDPDPAPADRKYIVCCKGAPVGVTLAKEDAGTLELLLDYTVPEYRDYSVGSLLLTAFRKEGVRKLVYRGPDVHHTGYLGKLGFARKETGEGGALYELDLT